MPPARAADDAPIEAKVTVDAATTLRTMDPQRIGGTNIATWIDAPTYASPEVRQWIADLRSTYFRLPGGSGANVFYWNGNGVRGADGKVDPSKVGPDGYPAVDYSGYAPGFSADPKTLHPASGDWHGNVDVKTLHEFIQAMPGAQAMACPNAGTGRAIDAAEWVKWANKKMGYDVRYWEIGNELDGSWEPGMNFPSARASITAEMYTKRYNEMASAMRKEDPTIKIGSCPFVEAALRDCGENVDFVSIHTYPGSTTMTDAEMFADISKTVERETTPVKQWIEQYQPQREDQIELAYTEWNLGWSVERVADVQRAVGEHLPGGNGEERRGHRHAVGLLHRSPSVPDGHGMIFGDEKKRTRKAQYYALWLWNNYMGHRLLPAKSDQPVGLYVCLAVRRRRLRDADQHRPRPRREGQRPAFRLPRGRRGRARDGDQPRISLEYADAPAPVEHRPAHRTAQDGRDVQRHHRAVLDDVRARPRPGKTRPFADRPEGAGGSAAGRRNARTPLRDADRGVRG